MITPVYKKLLMAAGSVYLCLPTVLLAATPLDLSDAPLAVSTTVEPNVMLLIDNSGSMDNIVWDIERNITDTNGNLVKRSTLPAPAAAPYDNTVTYPHWGSTDWSATNGNMSYGSINTGSCSSGYKEGRDPADNSIRKCLKLPITSRGNSTRYTGNYLNYLFNSYPSSTDLTSYYWMPQETRLETVKDSTTLLVNNIPNIRFGVASFNNTSGGRINANCGSPTSDLTSAISGLSANSWTPLAEAYYEVTRYFRGLDGYFNNTQYTSPIQYRCQQNFAVVLTDGLPTYDASIPSSPSSDPDVQSGCNSNDGLASTDPCLPNWDELAPATVQADSPNFPQYSDGFNPYSNSSSEGHALFLDDIAKFAYEIDLRTDPAKSGANTSDNGKDLANVSFDDLSFNEKFKKQNLKTFTIGFAINNQMLEDAAYYGQDPEYDSSGNIKTDVNGNIVKKPGYYTANDTTELASAFAKIIQGVQQTTGSAAAVAASTGFLTEDTLLFQALYDSNNWEGRLIAYELDENTRQITKDANGQPKVLWDAAEKLTALPYTSRFIATYGLKGNATSNPEGYLFSWSNFPASYVSALTYVDSANPTDTTDDQYIYEYTLGDRSREQLTASAQPQANGIFRSRGKLVQVDVPDANNPGFTKKQIIEYKSNLLGDIVNSSPAYVGQPVFPYPDVWNEKLQTLKGNNIQTQTVAAPENATGVEKYSDFRLKYSGLKQNEGYDRSDYAMIYVGANSGMLHGFKATNPNDKKDVDGNVIKAGDADAGNEKVAYIPSPVIPRLKDIADPNYSHKFYADGAPTVIDAFYASSTEANNPRWHTTLAAGLNNGGQGIYVLDVTDPKNQFSKTDASAKSLVQWEFTDADDADLGYTFAKPAIVRMSNGRWAVVFGNGYNNTIDDDGDASSTNDSTTGDSVIYIAFLEGPGSDGKWDLGTDYIKIDTGIGLDDDIDNPTHPDYHGGGTACDKNGTATGGTGAFDISLSKPNGMSTVAPVDTNGDFIVDFLYAGDLYGNLWKIDVRDASPTNWESVVQSGNNNNASAAPLFKARTGACPQPITTPPAVISAEGGSMVLFGTGKFIETSDVVVTNTSRTQTFYGLLDTTEYSSSPTTYPAKTDSSWTEQTILDSDSVNGTTRQFTNADTNEVHNEDTRVTSKNGANDGTYYNWYLDLPANGERVVFEPFTRGFYEPKVIFVTTIPSEDACTAGGISWLMELDARDGTQTEKPVFDLNYDGNLNGADNANSAVLNGWKTPGIATAPTVIAAGGVDIKAMSTSTGSLELKQEAPPEGSFGRQSWRQIK